MQLIDLAFDYDIKIEFDGDFDGGNYYLTMNYLSCTHHGNGETKTEINLKQEDIDRLYDGAKKLVKLLKNHATEGI